ncbi:MAG: hypothetical protein JRI23_13345 [Deltaproteobacteria bacterium]|jgi:hypothetical protein|nr:hypothetical protein [Deltaproteobacteria bacterium]MBW2532709.1 hypothetical protein [Deltaproteobacteria bacterium]
MSEQDATREVDRSKRGSGGSGPEPFTAKRPPPLDFDAWCEVATALLERELEERFEILADRDLDPTLWQRCDQYWTMVVAQEVVAGGSRRVDTYASRCAREMAKRREGSQDGGAKQNEGSAGTPEDAPAPAAAAIDETSWLMQAPVGPVLPFEEAPEASPPEQVVRLTDQRLDLAGETALATPVVDDLDSTLPFVLPIEDRLDPNGESVPSPTAPSARQGDPLEHYAALCAKLTVFPEQSAQIRASYGFATDEQIAGLSGRWQQRFDADPSLRARFEHLKQQYQRQLAARRSRG